MEKRVKQGEEEEGAPLSITFHGKPKLTEAPGFVQITPRQPGLPLTNLTPTSQVFSRH